MLTFAGISNPYGKGEYSVLQNAKVMQRYRFIHESLMRAGAGKMPAHQDWDLKLGQSKHIYEDAEAADLWRKRIPQLRTSSALLNKDPDPALSLVMDELIHAHNDLEYVIGVYDVLKPALLAVYKKHIAATQQIVDQPTIRILKWIIGDLEEQLVWGNEMLHALKGVKEYPADQADEFKQKLTAFLEAAGGVDGTLERSKIIPSRFRSHEPYALPLKSVRDPRRMGPVTMERTGVANPPADPAGLRLVTMMRIRQEEMTACELVSGVLYAQKNMPWEFYLALARHQWDEARHAMFGQAALEADGYDWMSRPQYTLDYDMTANKMPGATYAWLSIAVEEGAMVSNAKKQEYEFCRDEAKHPLMERFQDYDWADEVVHANIGRHWTPEIFGEEIGFVRKMAKEEMDSVIKEVDEMRARHREEETR